MDVFNQVARPWIIQEEGTEYVNDPRDNGGGSKFGVSSVFHPGVDVQNLTLEGALAFYLEEFWNPCRCGDMPAAVALAVFDCAINQGKIPAARMLQTTLGPPVKVDGIIGTKQTIPAVLAADPRYLIPGYLFRRLDRYRQHEDWKHFGSVWAGRLGRCYVRAVQLQKNPPA